MKYAVLVEKANADNAVRISPGVNGGLVMRFYYSGRVYGWDFINLDKTAQSSGGSSSGKVEAESITRVEECFSDIISEIVSGTSIDKFISLCGEVDVGAGKYRRAVSTDAAVAHFAKLKEPENLMTFA